MILVYVLMIHLVCLCRKSLPIPTVGDLTCRICGRVHPAEWYYAKEKVPSGIDSRCRPCMAFANYLRQKALHLARETQEPVTGKPCSRCKKWLPRASFSKGASSRIGLRSSCKSCDNRDAVIWREERKEYRSVQPAVAPEGKEQECCVCKVVKPWKNFSKDSKFNCGIRGRCKECDAVEKSRRDFVQWNK